MNTITTGRTALLLAAGLWIGLAGHVTPGLAQEADPAATTATEAPGKPIALKKFTKHHSAKKKVATATRPDKVKATKAKAEESDDAAPTVISEDAGKAALPAAVANANAQFPTAPASDPFAATTPAQANPLQADALIKSVGAEAALVAEPGAQIVSPDELNEVDRAAAEPRPALTLASATLDAPAAAPAPAAEASSTDNSTWDKTSLIGKIFIAFGGLLTMASAARMFIA